VDEGSVIAIAELTAVAAPIVDVQDNGLGHYNRIRTYSNAQTVEELSKQPLAGRPQHKSQAGEGTEVQGGNTEQVGETAVPTDRSQPLAGRQQHKTSLIVIPEHRSGADDRPAIDEMMNSAGDRRNMRVFVQDELVVRNDFGALGDDIAITYLGDVMQPPIPPPAVLLNSPTKRVEPFESLSVFDQVGAEMLKVSLALNNKDTPTMRAFTHVSKELIKGVGPLEPLSASDHVVAEMFAMPPALSDVPQNNITTNEPSGGIRAPIRI
jgi:hypothetical protein